MPQLWRNLKVGCDVEAWMNQGLVDTLAIGHHMVRSPGHTVRYELEPIAKLTRGRARLIVQVMRGCEMPVALELARQAYAHDADGTAIYESNIEVTDPSKRDAFKRLRHTL